MKIIPDTSVLKNAKHLIEHDFVDVARWKWENYPILNGNDISEMKSNLVMNLKQKKKNL